MQGIKYQRGYIRIIPKDLLLQQYVIHGDGPVIMLSVPKDELNLADLASRFAISGPNVADQNITCRNPSLSGSFSINQQMSLSDMIGTGNVF